MSEPSESWRVTYADGSNNMFFFTRLGPCEAATFRYSPMTPERSSSGTYSGGEPQQGELTQEQVDELWGWIERLLARARPDAKRTMGTGKLRVTADDEEPRGCLVPRSPVSRELEDFLRQFREGKEAVT